MSLNGFGARRQLRDGIIQLIGLFIGLIGVGCASVQVHTAGETQRLRWQAKDFHLQKVAVEDREIYKYTLVLEELQGKDLTFTYLTATLRNNAHSRQINWEKAGMWNLPAHGELRIPLGTYRYCNLANCRDWGPIAPVWNLTLTGTDSHGQPIHEVIHLRLPYVDETA